MILQVEIPTEPGSFLFLQHHPSDINRMLLRPKVKKPKTNLGKQQKRLNVVVLFGQPIPIGSMYGIYIYAYMKTIRNQPNVRKYTIHGSYGI